MESSTRTSEMARTTAWALAVAAVLAATLALAVPESAHAIGLVEVFTWGVANVIGYVFANIAYGLIANFLLPIADVAFSWSEDYISIPGVGMAILLFQVIALFAVVAIRLAIGIKDNVLLSGGSREGSLGEYMFKSLASVALVALMPMMVRTVFYFGHLVFTDVLGGTESITSELDNYFGSQGLLAAMVRSDNCEDVWSSLEFNGVQAAIVMVLTAIALVVLVVAVGYQFLRRQIEMVVISLIAPLVSIYAATENDSYMVRSLLTRSLGLALTMTIQYILVRVSIGFAESFMSAFCGEGTVVFDAAVATALNFPEVAPKFVLAIASLGCALSVPGIVNEFTTPTGNGQAGGMAMRSVQSIMMSTINKTGGAGQAISGGKAAFGAGKTAAAAAGTAAVTAGAGPIGAAGKAALGGIKGAASAIAGKGAGKAAENAGKGADSRTQTAQNIAGAARNAQQNARSGTGAANGWNSSGNTGGGNISGSSSTGSAAGSRTPASGSAAARPPATGSGAAGAQRAASIVQDAQRAASANKSDNNGHGGRR